MVLLPHNNSNWSLLPRAGKPYAHEENKNLLRQFSFPCAQVNKFSSTSNLVQGNDFFDSGLRKNKMNPKCCIKVNGIMRKLMALFSSQRDVYLKYVEGVGFATSFTTKRWSENWLIPIEICCQSFSCNATKR